jgi:tetratricopeptide (TPR) repeat protein
MEIKVVQNKAFLTTAAAGAVFVFTSVSALAAALTDPFSPSALARSICAARDGAKPMLPQWVAAARKTETGPFQPEPGAPRTAVDDRPALIDGLGTAHLPVPGISAEAQRYFDQGLRYAYGFNHHEAVRAFRAAQRLEPTCALCFWGEALVLGPNTNAPMDEAAHGQARVALRQAHRLAGNAEPIGRALIQALAVRYPAKFAEDRRAEDGAYAEAMAGVARKFPQNDEAALLAAEAMMDAQPWDYWERGGSTPKGYTAAAQKLIEGVLARNPDHAGAIHFYIHLLEASDGARRAEPYAERLAAQNLQTGHLVHMPSHIYYRVGRYGDALAANRKAASVDEAYFASAQPSAVYRSGYYPHNLHFVMVSAQMAGDGKAAIDAAEKLNRTLTVRSVQEMPYAEPVKASPYFAHAQYSDVATILALPDPGTELPFVRAMWLYARGVALAQSGDVAGAGQVADQLGRAAAATGDYKILLSAQVPVPDVIRISEQVVRSRIAQAQGNLPAAVAAMRTAERIEATLAYMEPPYWYVPVKQSLGGLLLLQGSLDEAEQAFRASLVQAPNNGWALYGLVEVAKAKGDTALQAASERDLEKAWVGDRSLLRLARL